MLSAISAVFVLGLLMSNVASAEPAHIDSSIALSGGPSAPRVRPLGDLLYLPDTEFIWYGDATDDDLAVAVALGNDPDLERRNPFRKHSFDLFRTERPVVIGRKEMVVKFRVRAKLREAMEVELKF